MKTAQRSFHLQTCHHVSLGPWALMCITVQMQVGEEEILSNYPEVDFVVVLLHPADHRSAIVVNGRGRRDHPQFRRLVCGGGKGGINWKPRLECTQEWPENLGLLAD